jgi:hypothetical protein
MKSPKVPTPDKSVVPSWAEQKMASAEDKEWPFERELRGAEHRNNML